MRIVYLAGREEEKPKKPRKPTAKQIERERANRLRYRMEMNDHKRILKKYAARIAEIKKHFPDWELPKPTLRTD